jgi:hypothetical protein
MGAAVGMHSVFAGRTVGSGRAGAPGIRCTPQVRLACQAVAVPGERYCAGLGIDVDGGCPKVQRWPVAVPLSGGLVLARAAERVSGTPAAAGLARIGQLRRVRTGGLIAILHAGGYARYDFRTAARLLEPSGRVDEGDEGQVAVIGRSFAAYLQPRAGWRRPARLGPGERAMTAAGPLEVTSARLWSEVSGRAGSRARPGMPAGLAGAGPRSGHGLLPGRPGLHGATAGQP